MRNNRGIFGRFYCIRGRIGLRGIDRRVVCVVRCNNGCSGGVINKVGGGV